MKHNDTKTHDYKSGGTISKSPLKDTWKSGSSSTIRDNGGKKK